ncbi:MAG TPA: hypothetical protein VJK04_02295 [Candidatus Paceibacterota bacterium]
MNKKTKIVLFSVVLGFVVVAGISYLVYDANRPGQLDAFATCLKDKDAVFYGAFWCQHCKNQKKMFGNSERLLSYVECSLPNGNGQNQTCNDKNIESYPTWEFADKSRETGEVPLTTLAAKTGCTLPADY